METLQDRFEQLTDLSVARRKRQGDKRRENLETEEFSVSNLVLLKVPGRSGAFQSSWYGPHEVVEVLSQVNYRVKDGQIRGGGRVVHINKLKSYKIREVNRDVVAEESELDRESMAKASGLVMELCDGFKQSDLDSVLREFEGTFSESPGCYTGGTCSIETEEGANPVNLPVQRIPFKLRDGVEQEIEKMLAGGIIEPAGEGEWCSPIVPVKKLDGSVRVCVDFRGLNQVTPLKRHYMPTLEELLDKAGSSKVLTTLDLTAGFHQIMLDETSKDLTTFGCPMGRFRYGDYHSAGFAESAAYLTPLTSKEAPDRVIWTSDADSAFVALKVSLCNAVCMCVPTTEDKFILYTDASARAVGGCLHVRRDGKELPVGFFSRILKDAETRYSRARGRHLQSCQHSPTLRLTYTVRR